GKTSLARILLNYAVRQGETPLYVDLDPRDASVTVPGTLSATPITHTVDIEAGFMGGDPASSIVWQFGHDSPADNQALFNALVDRMAESINRRLDADSSANASGFIADTRGASDAAIEHAVRALGITTLAVVGNERMYSLFSSRFAASSGVTVVKLARSGGTASRDAMFRQLSNARAIRRYFNGTESEPAMSYPTVASFDDVCILRVGEDAVAPSSSLPLGETRKLSETTVFDVACDEALTHSVLAVTEAMPPAAAAAAASTADAAAAASAAETAASERAAIVGAQAIGFVNVTRVDMEKRRLMLVAPMRGQLPRRETLLLSYHNSALYTSDPLTLREGGWLSDAILGFYFEYLAHDVLAGNQTVLFLKPALVQCLRVHANAALHSAAVPPDTFKRELVFIPINGSAGNPDDAHWSLLVYVRRHKPTFHYFDSMANANYPHALAVKDALTGLLRRTHRVPDTEEDPPLITHSCPQQENGSDCGIFVVLFADILTRRYADAAWNAKAEAAAAAAA
ncbi:Cleavage polyadenylation factor subunit clp1, partial [Coemansia sp. RSA 2399]